MHPRVSLHQVALLQTPTADFIAHCRAIGVGHATLVTPVLTRPGEVAAARGALDASGVKAATINHVFAVHPDLEKDQGKAAAGLDEAIAIAAELGAPAIYLISGGRGGLCWEDAAERFAALLALCKAVARDKGVRLLV